MGREHGKRLAFASPSRPGIERAIAERVEGRWRKRGYKKLDKLHARASTEDS